MVKLSGEFSEEAQEILNDLHVGIDVGKNFIKITHDFEIKLLAFDNLIMHIEFEYGEHEDLHAFFMEVSGLIVDLREELEKLGKAEIHIVKEEQAMENLGLKHIKKINEKIVEEIGVSKSIIQKVHLVLQRIKELFVQADHLFSIDIEKAQVKNVVAELEAKEKEVKHILERLISFFIAHEKIFARELARLEGI